MCSCRGPSTCKQGRRLYKRCSCKQWPCTYTAPCVARTCWEESQTHIAAPFWQRRSTHPARALMHAANAPRRGRSCTDQQHTPRRSTGNRTPSTTRTPTIRPPGGIPDIRSTHPHSPDQTPSRPRWKLCSTRSPTRSGPQTARKPARLQRRTGFLFSYAHDQEHRQHDPAGKNCIESLPACTTPSRSARRRHTARPGTPASTGTPSALEAVPTPGGRLGREAPAADDQPHTGNPCPSRPARPAPAFVLEHPRRTRSGAPGIHTQTPRSSSAGLYCQAMPPGIRHKAHCKAHGKAFFQE